MFCKGLGHKIGEYPIAMERRQKSKATYKFGSQTIKYKDDSQLNNSNIGFEVVLNVPSRNNGPEENNSIEMGALVPPPRTKPIIFIPISDAAREELK